MSDKVILDACCGSRMFWFNKQHPNAVYMDNRELEDALCDGRNLIVKPDIIADFRNIPYKDNSFKLVVFDPPHLIKAGDNSWLAKKYGKLNESWPTDLKQGFDECMRVLEPGGTLIFKWNEEQIKLKQVLNAIGQQPLFGDKRSKTHWLVFMKGLGA
nr:methyltransferase domain-containing protein [uncultured Anaerocolumna sp.]